MVSTKAQKKIYAEKIAAKLPNGRIPRIYSALTKDLQKLNLATLLTIAQKLK